MILIILSLIYQIQVADNINFNSIIVDEITTGNSYQVMNPIGDGEFYWRVRAKELYEWSNWSEVWKFTIDTYIPPTPVLISPSNNAVLNNPTPILIWSMLNKIPPYPPYNGDTLYVNPNGDNSRTRDQAKNYETPWRTLHYAIAQLQPGDMLIAQNGIYAEGKDDIIFTQIWVGGNKNNWKIIKSENLFGAKIDGRDSLLYGLL